MIDVQSYIDKLEIAKEWMSAIIDIKQHNRAQRENFWYMYIECGIIMTAAHMHVPTFEEYLNNMK